MNNTTFCTRIGHLNPEYCGITKQWVPRLTQKATLACVVFPCFFSVMCTAIGLPVIWRNFQKLGLYEREKKSNPVTDKKSWIPELWYKYKFHITVYITPIVPLVWDSVDVVLDGLYFYNLEQGGLISNNITRNVYVNNSLITYAAIGSLKTPLLVLIIGRFWEVLFTPKQSDFTFKLVALSPRAIGNLYVSIVIYITEDCAESFLEYFWIEKYISDHPSSAVVLRNVFKAVVSFIPLISQLLQLKDRLFIAEQIDNVKQKCHVTREISHHYEEDDQTFKCDEEKCKRQKIFICWIGLTVISLMSSVGSFLRAIGAVHQLITHEIPASCLFVDENGLLYQSPLEDECLRFIDYSIIFFNFLPLLVYALGIIVYLAGHWYYKICLLNCHNQQLQPLHTPRCDGDITLKVPKLDHNETSHEVVKGTYKIAITVTRLVEENVRKSREGEIKNKIINGLQNIEVECGVV